MQPVTSTDANRESMSGKLQPGMGGPSRTRALVAAILAIAILVVCLCTHLGALGLTGPDEARYAWIARSMASTGDWVTPKLYNQPWFEKPALYYWGAAAGFQILKSPEYAARIPSALGALAAAFTIAMLGWIFYGRRTAWLALLMFPTIATVSFARAATPDMLFSTFLTITLATAAGILCREGALGELAPDAPPTFPTAMPDRIFFGASLGAATLAKGPAAVVLGAGSLLLWAIATKRFGVLRRFFHPAAVISFAVVALPWYVMCARRNPDFLRTFLLHHNFDRYLTPVFQHRQPFWFFLPILLIAIFPWTPLLIAVARDAWNGYRRRDWKSSPAFLFACWIIFPVVFFSFSQSKLPGYILPAVPALILLLAVSADHLIDAIKANSPPARLLLATVGLLWLLLGLAAALPHFYALIGKKLAFAPPPTAAMLTTHVHRLVIFIALAGLVSAAIALARRGTIAVVVIALAFTALAEDAGRRVLPKLDPWLSARAMVNSAEKTSAMNIPWESLQLNRSWQFDLNFYLQREILEWNPDSPYETLVLTNAKGIEDIRRAGRDFVALAPDFTSGEFPVVDYPRADYPIAVRPVVVLPVSH
jgi:4-amino-4-deoxy-L-arabinose transferase-like glycosyltransferase